MKILSLVVDFIAGQSTTVAAASSSVQNPYHRKTSNNSGWNCSVHWRWIVFWCVFHFHFLAKAWCKISHEFFEFLNCSKTLSHIAWLCSHVCVCVYKFSCVRACLRLVHWVICVRFVAHIIYALSLSPRFSSTQFHKSMNARFARSPIITI